MSTYNLLNRALLEIAASATMGAAYDSWSDDDALVTNIVHSLDEYHRAQNILANAKAKRRRGLRVTETSLKNKSDAVGIAYAKVIEAIKATKEAWKI